MVTAVPRAKEARMHAGYAELDLTGSRLGQQQVNSCNH
jgi:hypothetical protein